MNRQIAPETTATHPEAPRADENVIPFDARRAYRDRDFGIGYGRSSGYAADKRYTSDWGQPRFRCA